MYDVCMRTHYVIGNVVFVSPCIVIVSKNACVYIHVMSVCNEKVAVIVSL